MLDQALHLLTDLFGRAQQSLFEAVVEPVMFHIGLASLIEDAYDATGWMMVGFVELLVLLLVIRQLERLWPVETIEDRSAVHVDVIYTLVHRLGLFRLALFFAVDPIWDFIFGRASVIGLPTWQLDTWMAPWWPGVTDSAWFAFAIYLIVFDLLNYWVHRGQHGLNWWWQLHSLHHSQRQMTMWSDSRNHLLDDVLTGSLTVLVARLIGIPPGQFVAVVAMTQLVENLSHANTRVHFGWLFERLVVSPRFHRLHHSIGIGHESRGQGTLGGHNFGVLSPVWDVLFGTSNFERRYDKTGIRDQLPDATGRGGRDYGRGFWEQQWLGMLRLVGKA